jgi:hypothetical protein
MSNLYRQSRDDYQRQIHQNRDNNPLTGWATNTLADIGRWARGEYDPIVQLDQQRQQQASQAIGGYDAAQAIDRPLTSGDLKQIALAGKLKAGDMINDAQVARLRARGELRNELANTHLTNSTDQQLRVLEQMQAPTMRELDINEAAGIRGDNRADRRLTAQIEGSNADRALRRLGLNNTHEFNMGGLASTERMFNSGTQAAIARDNRILSLMESQAAADQAYNSDLLALKRDALQGSTGGGLSFLGALFGG